MIGTCSRCKKKEQDVRRIESYQLCKKCFNQGKHGSSLSKSTLEKYDKIW